MSAMARILVTEEIADGGLDRLRAAGHDVDVRLGLSPDELLDGHRRRPRPDHPLGDARSPTRCSPPAPTCSSSAGPASASTTSTSRRPPRRGVMVVNAPQSNIVSAAEHTMALLLAQARNVPQAHAALVAGRWERSRWEGVELADKTLGIVGLGRIGKLVADRARGFGMRLVAYDPFVSAERARQLGVELLPLDQVVAESDFLTIHLPKTTETTGLIGRDLLLKAKPTLRVINVARGGIVDEAALADAVRDGVIAGAALDVFDTEPTTESPLFELDVGRRHAAPRGEHPRGAGQGRRHDRRHGAAGARRRVRAVRRQPRRRRGPRDLRPFLPLAERLGRLFASLVARAAVDASRSPSRARSAATTPASSGCRCSRACSAASATSRSPTSTPRSGPRTPASTSARSARRRSADYVNLITISGGGHSMSGTLAGRRSEHRIVLIDDHTFDVPPADHMLMVTNDDRPGVIGTVGTLLGDAGVNIADMDVGRADEAGTAVMLIAPTSTGRPGDASTPCAPPPASSRVAALLTPSTSLSRRTRRANRIGRRRRAIASRVRRRRRGRPRRSRRRATRRGSPATS